jgi:hypothetical protein
MVALTFRGLGAWGSGKGSDLIASEIDNNFWSLAEAIFLLQNDPATPVGIASIAVSGTQMTITLTDGTVLAPVTLPVLTFRWRGAWEPATGYAVLDTLSDPATGIYMVQIAHTSPSTFDPNMLVGGLPAFLQLFGIATLAAGSVVSLAAGGTDQATAPELTAEQNYVSGASGTNGVKIAASRMIPGNRLYVTNESTANRLSFYPSAGAKVNNLAVNVPASLYPDTTTLFIIKDATQIRTVP